MKRIKSIDVCRGFAMLWMMLGHLTEWSLKSEYYPYRQLLGSILDPMGASAFLFIAGISTMISYRNRLEKAELNETYSKKKLKYEYFFRALILFSVALAYNFFVAVRLNDLSWIWTWFILLTISISLLISWFLLEVPNWIKVLIAIFLWILDYFLLSLLLPFQGEVNFFGILYYILYNTLDLDPIVQMYSFFLIGLVIGDLLVNVYKSRDEETKREYLKKKVLIPLLAFGMILAIFGILFQFPLFFTPRTYPWLYYSLGIELIVFSTLLYVEEFRLRRLQKSYKFLFYYSYYSLTTYLLHNLFFFLFNDMLDPFTVWIYVIIVIFLYGLFLKFIYIKLGARFSLKAQIGLLAYRLTENVLKPNNTKIEN